ncbi:MAG: apolipoprotein N-acyltransferase [Pseudomonadales bacterium]
MLALLAGLLLPLSLAPFELWPLAPLSAGLLFWVLLRSPQRPLVIGWLFGVGKYGLGASWIYVSIHEFGHASVPLSLFLVSFFVVSMALFPLTQFWLYGRLRSGFASADALLFVVLWVVWEWLLTWVLSGFPWLFAGSGQLQGPFAGYAPLGGVLLVSLLVVLAGCAIAVALPRATTSAVRWRWLGGALLVLLGGFGLTRVAWVEPVAQRSAALVQGNIDQITKWQPEQRGPIIDRLTGLSEAHWGVDLLLWPEAAITLYEHQAQPLLERWGARGAASGTTLVLGLPGVEVLPGGAEPEYRFSNRALAVGAGSGRYAKRRLVPFGEYVPMEGLLRGLIGFFDLPMSHSDAGPAAQPLLRVGDDLAAMAICYEVAYPSLVNGDFPGPDVLLTISNDAWFGGSIGPHQHLQIARMRALEHGRYLLRATNNGLTAIVDERGRVLQQLPQFEPGVLRGHYQTLSGLTPFAQFGHLILWIAIVSLLLLVLFLRARNRSHH